MPVDTFFIREMEQIGGILQTTTGQTVTSMWLCRETSIETFEGTMMFRHLGQQKLSI